MKKFLRIILPLVMVIVIIASVCWYLFVFDRPLLQEFLLYSARRCTDDGNYKAASWFYSQAYSHSGKSDQVAIELANAYLQEGNLTKVEYTLSNAISDGGSADLYTMLCKTYVMQDKLLDAVNMLDNISDPAVKAEVEALRPKAPVPTPAPAFYNQYIHVSFQYQGGQLYYTTDKQYPTQDSQPYSEPIALSGGETLIYALVVGDNGLVSPLSIYGYTVGGVIEPVVFQDSAIEKAVREVLDLDDSKVVYTNALWTLTEFTVPEDAVSLGDLRHMTYLRSLTMTKQDLTDAEVLSSLQQLQTLAIYDSRVTNQNLLTIAALPNLTSLTLSDCSLSSIDALANAQDLTYLDLSDNSIQNIQVLSSMSLLEELNMSQNALTSITVISGLRNLKTLNVSSNSLGDIAALGACGSLQWLDVSKNNLAGLGALDNLRELTYLSASNNSLTDVSVLGKCPSITYLDLSNNLLTQIDVISQMPNLLELNISGNSIAALPNLSEKHSLVTLNAENNLLTDISVLGVLDRLNNVYITNNAVADISVLAGCHNLVRIHAYGNPIPMDIAQPLIDMGIVVQYDPTIAANATEPT